ncbi:transcription antitermination factor NusB [Flavobacterium sp. SUN046]|uniref:transcription antitermination factor NusB n=1 Tax=Flavobacterium sp. SUN046 TaxID=3002440 RepID=UPI002DB84A09|nr:transcription antitermination factor NusB [Flavobacterium sp. SUN046]MEC4050489.1 transcription antitermination factor NusB [Flavobacterium sp. SUN046]
MQTIYAMHQTGSDNLEKEEKFLLASLDSIMDLYLIMITSLIELRNKEEEHLEISSKKHLATAEERNPNKKFINNVVLQLLAENNSISIAVEKRKITNWAANDDAILLLLQDVKQSDIYKDYMAAPPSDFATDRKFVAELFSEVVAPNEKLYSYLEDHRLTWIDDIPVVNTQILKELKQITKKEDDFRITRIFKDVDDKDYAIALFRKTVLNETELAKEFMDKTPNWDFERIAELDTIILKMAICEFLKFPSIPVKVTINEYLELAKEYSTPRSSVFINGILDNIVKDFTEADRIKKSGRGLMTE